MEAVRPLLKTEGLETAAERQLAITTEAGTLRGRFVMPGGAAAVVVLARTDEPSARTLALAAELQRRGFGTCAVELLTREEQVDPECRSLLRFDVRLLGRRLVAAIDAVAELLAPPVRLGLFGSGTGAAAVLIAAASRGDLVDATVLRAGRPDLAIFALRGVQAPTLMIVGSNDEASIHCSEIAAVRLRAPHHVHLVAGASRLFAEPGAMDDVLGVTCSWFEGHLPAYRATDGSQERHGHNATHGTLGHSEPFESTRSDE